MKDASSAIAYLEYLEKITEIQTINFKNLYQKLKVGQKIKVYCGYEISGKMHLGTFLTYSLLLKLAEFSCVEVVCLIADFHTLLNNKMLDNSLESELTHIANLKNVPIKFLKNHDSGKGFIYTEDFQKTFIKVNSQIKISKLKKGTAFFKRADFAQLRCSEVNYVLHQITDMQYLMVDLAIGGTDQRKIHMLHNDTVKKIAYLHIPLLQSNTGIKMSKSIANSVLTLKDLERSIDADIYEKFKKLIELITESKIKPFLKAIKINLPE